MKNLKPERRRLLRRVLSFVFSRLTLTMLLLDIQAFWLFSLFFWLADYAKGFNIAGLILSVLMCLALIRQDSTAPEFKISWMVLFMITVAETANRSRRLHFRCKCRTKSERAHEHLRCEIRLCAKPAPSMRRIRQTAAKRKPPAYSARS